MEIEREVLQAHGLTLPPTPEIPQSISAVRELLGLSSCTLVRCSLPPSVDETVAAIDHYVQRMARPDRRWDKIATMWRNCVEHQ